MRSMLVAAFALLCAILPARADWPLDRMNAQIDATNVIVSGICSGTVVSVEERLVLTAHHCVEGNLREVEKREVDPKTGEIRTKMVQERVPMYIETWSRFDYAVTGSKRQEAKIVGDDPLTDVAILQVVDTSWVPAAAAPFAPDDYDYMRGRVVFAVGNPAIEFDNSLTTGIISAPYRRESFGSDLKKIPLFQHSANTIGGNSGGAVYNDNGQLIGTCTGILPGSDISLAVPIVFSKALIRKAGFGKILDRK